MIKYGLANLFTLINDRYLHKLFQDFGHLLSKITNFYVYSHVIFTFCYIQSPLGYTVLSLSCLFICPLTRLKRKYSTPTYTINNKMRKNDKTCELYVVLFIWPGILLNIWKDFQPLKENWYSIILSSYYMLKIFCFRKNPSWFFF